ncbi:MAG: M50 family metallopeptidase [Arachnia sp.]
MNWWDQVWQRVVPGSSGGLAHSEALIALAAAVAVVVVPPVWRVVRVAVTLVHELGHAMIGVLFGRRFTGFVVNADMSGHAITVGPDRGIGRIATTWAGYPAPAVVGAGLCAGVADGYAAGMLTGMLLVLLFSLIRVRSLLTAVVTLAAGAGLGALWWYRDDQLQASVLLAVGGFLIIGAWRQLGAVIGSRDPHSDPAQLGARTFLPRGFWLASFVVVVAAATLLAGWLVIGAELTAS